MDASHHVPRNIEDILSRLSNVKASGPGRYTADCPVPGHKTPSGHLTLKDVGDKALITCQGGRHDYCAICAAIGFETLAYSETSNKSPSHRTIISTYDYTDESGALLYQTVRYEPKDFTQRRPDGKGGWIWSLKGVRRVLYHLTEVIGAVQGGRMVYKVAGEKDADNLRKLGLTVTTNPLGEEKGKWKPEFTETLRGAHVVVIQDKDATGHRHGQEVARALYGKAANVKVLELPDRDGHHVKDASDWIAAGGTREELEQLVADCPDYEPSPSALLCDATLPTVVCSDRHLREKTNDALEAIYQANTPERIFRRGGALSRISRDDENRPMIEMMSESALRGHMERCANFIRFNAEGEVIPVPPPLDVVSDIQSLGDWSFPPLLGITEAPAIRPDGTILATPGYDSATHLYCAPAPGLVVPPISDNPTKSEVKATTELVLEVLCDFPFDSEASKANAVGALMVPILRPMIAGLVPMAVFDKPQPGTGASLLADAISVLATGRHAATMGEPRSEEECEKKLNSHLLEGRSLCVIDNVDGKLWSDTLARFLTSLYLSVRPLGRSADLRLLNRLTYMVTGNNIQLGGDLPRRCYWIRLNAGMARPWLRDGFRHPKLTQWISENRGAILAAVLTIARAWVVAGQPEAPELLVLGGYEGFCRVVGNILDFMGVKGFLTNLSLMYDEMDTDTPQWETFLETWREVIGEMPVTVAELIKTLDDSEELASSLPDSLATRDSRNYSRRLGNALAKRNQVRLPSGLMVAKAGTRNRAIAWQVSYQDEKTTNSYSVSLRNELAELGSTLPHTEKIGEDKDKEKIYREGVGANSFNSFLASERDELGVDNSSGAVGDDGGLSLSQALGMSVDEALPLWRREGAPIIHLGAGENCHDLAKLLGNHNINNRQLAAVKAWLAAHR